MSLEKELHFLSFSSKHTDFVCLKDLFFRIDECLQVKVQTRVKSLGVQVRNLLSSDAGVETESCHDGVDFVVGVREDTDARVVVVAVQTEADLLGETAAAIHTIVTIDGCKSKIAAQFANLLLAYQRKPCRGFSSSPCR